jgi:hypothetical protein
MFCVCGGIGTITPKQTNQPFESVDSNQKH